jgi:putative protease
MSGKRIGIVTHFFDRISVAVLELTDKIRVGDTLHFLGHATDFKQEVRSLQIEHQNMDEAELRQMARKLMLLAIKPQNWSIVEI